MTPDGVVESRNTARALYTQGPSLGFVDGATGGCWLYGISPFVDLGEGRYLFADVDESIEAVFRAAREAGFMDTGDRWRDLRKLTRSRGEVWRVPDHSIPTLVTLRDQGDITTAELVDPHDLAAAFGPDYELLSMTVQVTNEPTTERQLAPLFAEWILDDQPYFNITDDGRAFPYPLTGAFFWAGGTGRLAY